MMLEQWRIFVTDAGREPITPRRCSEPDPIGHQRGGGRARNIMNN
jgi:hypothetical protein